MDTQQKPKGDTKNTRNPAWRARVISFTPFSLGWKPNLSEAKRADKSTGASRSSSLVEWEDSYGPTQDETVQAQAFAKEGPRENF